MRTWRNIETYLRAREITYTCTYVFGDAQSHHQPRPELSDDRPILVAVGGDGTLHFGATRALELGYRFGAIPAGTGNDFAKCLHLPDDPEQAVDSLLSGQFREIDILMMAGQPVINVGGIGLDASIAHRMEGNPGLKRMGKLGYAAVLPVVLGTHRTFSLQLTVDGEDLEFQDVSLLAVANNASFGGGMMICPGAVPDDGEMDICIVNGFSRTRILRLFPLIYSGMHVHQPGVYVIKAKKAKVVTDRPILMELDGEPQPALAEFTVDIKPRTLEIVAYRT